MSPKARRRHWVSKLAQISESFSNDSAEMINDLQAEIEDGGHTVLLDHLRLCGSVPEHYDHDSSEEKLYSKYTDAVVSASFQAIGLRSTVILARADAADVQATGGGYSLVADAKAFRLSRTAKNQKDFKIQALDGWRNGLDYAVVVCPIYQLPSRASQIYQQAIARNVCILSYSHLATLATLANRRSSARAMASLKLVLDAVASLHPSKSSVDYWRGINEALLNGLRNDGDIWTNEKVASLKALEIAKDEALTYLRTERDRLLGLSHKQALDELIRAMGLESRIKQVESVEHGDLLG